MPSCNNSSMHGRGHPSALTPRTGGVSCTADAVHDVSDRRGHVPRVNGRGAARHAKTTACQHASLRHANTHRFDMPTRIALTCQHASLRHANTHRFDMPPRTNANTHRFDMPRRIVSTWLATPVPTASPRAGGETDKRTEREKWGERRGEPRGERKGGGGQEGRQRASRILCVRA